MEIRPIFSALLRSKTGAVLIVAQVALTLAILCNAIYVVQDRLATAARPSGADEANTFRIQFQAVEDVPDEEAMQRADVEALRAIPGVVAAAWVNQQPHNQSGWGLGLAVDPTIAGSGIGAAAYMSPDSLVDAFGLRLVEGRDFLPGEVRQVDPGEQQPGADVVILSKAMASRLFPDEERVVGRKVYLGTGADAAPMEVVGVVERLISPWAQLSPGFEQSFIMPVRFLNRNGEYAVRTAPGQRERVMAEAEKVLTEIRPNRINLGMEGFDELRANRYRNVNAVAGLLIAVSAGLLLVTASGIVGMASLWVNQRRKQIGTRRALGATRSDILRYFVTENLMITGAGVGLGLALAVALNLFLVREIELATLPPSYLAFGAFGLFALGVLAVLGPAWRAAAVPPAVATRTA